MDEYKKLERICQKIRRAKIFGVQERNNTISMLVGGLCFQLSLNNKEALQTLEGGVIMGEGEQSEMVQNPRLKVKTSYVTLNVIDPQTQRTIESYTNVGDSININYVDDQNKPITRPILLDLYRELRGRIQASASLQQTSIERAEISSGRKKLDRFLR